MWLIFIFKAVRKIHDHLRVFHKLDKHDYEKALKRVKEDKLGLKDGRLDKSDSSSAESTACESDEDDDLFKISKNKPQKSSMVSSFKN